MRWLFPVVLFTDACSLENSLGAKGHGVAGSDSRADTAGSGGDTAPPEPGSCSASPAWALEVGWTSRLALSVPFGGVVVGPLTRGGPPAVVVASPGSGVMAYAGVDGAQLWQHSLPNAAEMTAPALGDLDGDGAPEVVVPTNAGIVTLHGDGSEHWTVPGPGSIKPVCGGPGIADLDDDGIAEVYLGRLILDGRTGAVRGEGVGGWGTTTPGEAPLTVAADLFGEGRQLVLAGNAAYAPDGSTVWQGTSDGYPSVADLDEDGRGDIVVGGASSVFRVDADGAIVWSVTSDSAGPPAIADFLGDGHPTIAVPTNSGVDLLNAEGERLWTHAARQGDYFTNGVSGFDLDGDGAAEVLLSSEEGLFILDGASGALLATSEAFQPFCAQGPVVADLDGDGHAELVVLETYTDAAAVVVYRDRDGFVDAQPIWNQHAYNVTNVTADGCVPVNPASNWPHPNLFRASTCPE